MLQPLRPRSQARDGGERYLRNFWVSRRGGFYRLALIVLTAWGGYNLIGSSHGVLHLRALAREEAELKDRLREKTAESHQVAHELREDPMVEMERGLREKYFQSREGEIVYRLRRSGGTAADSGWIAVPNGDGTDGGFEDGSTTGGVSTDGAKSGESDGSGRSSGSRGSSGSGGSFGSGDSFGSGGSFGSGE